MEPKKYLNMGSFEEGSFKGSFKDPFKEGLGVPLRVPSTIPFKEGFRVPLTKGSFKSFLCRGCISGYLYGRHKIVKSCFLLYRYLGAFGEGHAAIVKNVESL